MRGHMAFGIIRNPAQRIVAVRVPDLPGRRTHFVRDQVPRTYESFLHGLLRRETQSYTGQETCATGTKMCSAHRLVPPLVRPTRTSEQNHLILLARQ